MSIRPSGHPTIPVGVNSGNIIAIVTIRDPKALRANQHTHFRKTRLNGQRSNEGCHVFLEQVNDRSYFSFGRGDTRITDSPDMDTRDVYLPGRSALKQFLMLPVWDSNVWRLQSTTETVAKVNNAPIQASTKRTLKNKKPLPHAIHLNQNSANRVLVNGLQIDIWLLKSVRDVYSTQPDISKSLVPHLQDVSHRRESWAHERYILSRTQVSTRSYRIVERFTGQLQTVKLFQQEHDAVQLRDEEYLRLAKEETDVSVVRYLQSVEINNIPGIITSTHEGFASYAALQLDIKRQHPGLRFAIATKLLRRLFSALDFLHFHGVIHGQISQESVLIQLRDYQVDGILLVDYSHSTSFIKGASGPDEEMIADSRAVMEIIEDCCDIWQLRKAATKDATSEAWMSQMTITAKKEYDSVHRVVSDCFGRQGNIRTSEKGQKLLRLLAQKENDWHLSQNRQIRNAKCRVVGPCYRTNIQDMVKDWDKVHPQPRIGEKIYMNLSLGHPWLDSLADKLYLKQWNLTPHEIVAKIRELAGEIEAPWQTFKVKVVAVFRYKKVEREVGFDEECIATWLAGHCEVYPEWRPTLEMECKNHIRPQQGNILHAALEKLRDALLVYGKLPESMETTFELLATLKGSKEEVDLQVLETHRVAYHVPSRLFNLTQLQRIASIERFVSCVSDGDIRCDNFIEVRGEPKLQGCYAPLSMLSVFADQLGVIVREVPDFNLAFPTFDASDFSQFPAHKIALARTGLFAFASVIRSGDQFMFYAPKYPRDFETGSFLPTYFGDMKVLPTLPEGKYEHFRPDHWSKFRTAEETEDSADLGKRRILPAKGQLSQTAPATPPSPTSTTTAVDKSIVSQALKARALLRSQARLPTKRNTDAQSSDAKTPTAKRCRSSCVKPPSSPPVAGRQVSMSFLDRAIEHNERIAEPADPLSLGSSIYNIPRIPNTSFYQRGNGVNTNLLSSPPRSPIDKNRSFTIPTGSFDLDDDRRQVDAWLEKMPDKEEDDEPQVAGLFPNLQFHHDEKDNGSDTEEEDLPEQFQSDKNKGKGKQKAVEKAAAKSFTFGQSPFGADATSTDGGKEKASHQLTLPFRSFSGQTSVTPGPASVSFNGFDGHRRQVAVTNFTSGTSSAQPPRDLSTRRDFLKSMSSNRIEASASFPVYPSGYAAQMEGVQTAGDSTTGATEVKVAGAGASGAKDVQMGQLDDDDMPSTDGESFGEKSDEDMPDTDSGAE